MGNWYPIIKIQRFMEKNLISSFTGIRMLNIPPRKQHMYYVCPYFSDLSSPHLSSVDSTFGQTFLFTNRCRMHQLLTHFFFERFAITAAPRQRGRRAFESAWLEFRLRSFWSKPEKAPVLDSGKKQGKFVGSWSGRNPDGAKKISHVTSSFMVDFPAIATSVWRECTSNSSPGHFGEEIA